MANQPLSGEGASASSPVPGTQKKVHRNYLIVGTILGILVILIIAAFLTLSVKADLPPDPGTGYPYTTTYAVLIPDGLPIRIAETPILVLTSGNELIMKIGDQNEKFVAGQTKTISERRAEFRALGIPLLSTNYLIEATYRGRSGPNADFFLIVRTSRQVPSFLIERILPAEIQARPA
jgi:hypothetical protein